MFICDDKHTNKPTDKQTNKQTDIQTQKNITVGRGEHQNNSHSAEWQKCTIHKLINIKTLLCLKLPPLKPSKC